MRVIKEIETKRATELGNTFATNLSCKKTHI